MTESNYSNFGMYNKHSNHYWSRKNLLLVHPRRLQVRFTIIGPLFYEGLLTYWWKECRIYEWYLYNFLNELDIKERPTLYFQQDGASTHRYQRTDLRNFEIQQKKKEKGTLRLIERRILMKNYGTNQKEYNYEPFLGILS